MSTLPHSLLDSFDCKQGAVRAVRFNSDGNYCLTCGSDKTVKLWTPMKKAHLKTYACHGSDVLDVRASFDNNQLISCSTDKTVVLYDVETGKSIRKYRGHAGIVNCVHYNDESTVIFSGSIDSTVRIWDCKSRSLEPIQILEEAKDSVTSIAVSDSEIVTGSADCKLRRYDIRKGKLFEDYVGKTISCVSLTRDGQCILCSTMDSSVKLFDKATGEMLNEYTGHKNDQYKVESCLSPSDTHVMTGSEDGQVYIYDLVEGSLTLKLDHKTRGTVASLAPHPGEEPYLLTAALFRCYVWRSLEFPENKPLSSSVLAKGLIP